MATYTIPVYEQQHRYYCSDCKPKGKSEKGTLVVSTYDQFCVSCGRDFREMAEQREQAEISAKTTDVR